MKLSRRLACTGWVTLTLLCSALQAREESVHKAHKKTTAVVPEYLMPRAVTSFGAASLGGYAYTLGGWFGTPHDYHREDQSSSFARMNLLDGTWQELPSPGQMQSVALVAHGRSIYRVGGMIALNAPGTEQELISSKEFAAFDTAVGEWRELEDLPQPRSSHEAARVGDDLWVLGGWNLADQDGEGWHTQALRFDLSDPAGTWEPLPAPFQRRALGVASLGDVIVAIGGIDPAGDLSSRVDVLSVEDRSWSRGPDYPQTGFGLAVVGHEGRFWASAGDGGIYSWAPGEEAWRLETAWVFPRFFHQLIVSPGEIWAFGGVARGGRIRHVERLELGAVPDLRTTHWRLPRAGRAIADQGLFSTRNSIIAFGGLSADGSPVDDVYRLDLAQLAWDARTALPAPIARARTAALSTGSAVAVAAKFEPLALSAFEYEAKYDLWTETQAPAVAPGSAVPVVLGGQAHWFVSGAAADDSTAIALPTPRRDFAVAVVGEQALVLGGVDSTGAPVLTCDSYSWADQSWSSGPSLPVGRVAPAIAVVGERVYLAGGRTSKGQVPTTLDELDLRAGTWSTITTELPIAAASVGLIAFGDRLLVYAPEHEGEALDVVLVDPGRGSVHARDVGGHFGE